jgi:hypothetical protein
MLVATGDCQSNELHSGEIKAVTEAGDISALWK